MYLAISVLLAAVLAGSLVYCVLVLVAVRRFTSHGPAAPVRLTAPVSILKPLHGLDLGLEDNLRSFFAQDYPGEFELLFATRDPGDPALILVDRLSAEHPQVPVRKILTGEPPWANAKVWSLDRMMREARHDLLVMSDSDIRVDRMFLQNVVADFADPSIGLATCPYRAVAGPSLWSRLEAVGMNTEFWAGVLVARMLEGVKFTVGPTVVGRRSVIEAVGGWDRVKDYLAEDFVLGAFAAEKGIGVILSRTVVEHRIGSESLRANFTHRVRWNRSTRRSRPAGYIGQLFTNPLPIALMLVALQPFWWPALAVTCVLRAAVAASVARVLRAPAGWALLPFQDILSFVFWLSGFFGSTIHWRGRKYRLLSDGRFELVEK